MDKELLGTLVAEAKDALETLEKQLVQAQEEYEEATKTAKRSNYICNELLTWYFLNASFNQVEQLKAVSTYDGAEIFEEISEKGA